MSERALPALRAVVWDLDGTLSDDRARLPFGLAGDWVRYFDDCERDPPIEASLVLLRALHAAGLTIVFLTGRPEAVRSQTEAWLQAHGLTEYDALLMRNDGDWRSNAEYKAARVAELRERWEVLCAFEDQPETAEALRREGIAVFLYGAAAAP